MGKLAIVLLTAKTTPERALYAQATLKSTLERLRTTHDVHLHIGDDGSSPDHVYNLKAIANEYSGVWSGCTATDSGHTGYGANYNLSMRTVHDMGADYILPLEDDWELNRPEGFDVDPIITVLKDGVFDSVRMGYIGYTQKLVAEFVYCNDLHWLRLDPELSHEPHVFSGHPRIETVAYQKRVGPWPEGLTPGETEWAVATSNEYKHNSRRGIAWPLTLLPDIRHGAFEHIGTVKSY